MSGFFSDRERRSLLVFLPLAGLFILCVALIRQRPDADAANMLNREMVIPMDSARLIVFDPNTVTYRELLSLGFIKETAVGLLRYRAAGKTFRIKEDLALCYGITDSIYSAIEPYIAIGPEFRYKPKYYADHTHGKKRGIVAFEPFLIDTASAAYFVRLGFSPKQAAAIARYRLTCGGISDIETLAGCFVVGDSVARLLAPYVIFTDSPKTYDVGLIEINGADSAALRSVVGIGEKTVMAIMAYRERLGGFISESQLAEVRGVTEGNFERIVKQIYCDSCRIKKIDVNFASPDVMGRHPYIPPHTLRKLLKIRQLKGGWRTVGELVEDKILTREEAERLAPYLLFGAETD